VNIGKHDEDVSIMETGKAITRESRFQPKSEPMSVNTLNVLRGVSIFLIIFTIVAPVMLGSSPATSNLYIGENTGFAPSS
jgi:hypothetical protein